MEQRQRGGLHEAVESCAREAHVVSAADMVDACLGGLRQKCPRGLLPSLQQVEGREDADPNQCGHGLPVTIRLIDPPLHEFLLYLPWKPY